MLINTTDSMSPRTYSKEAIEVIRNDLLKLGTKGHERLSTYDDYPKTMAKPKKRLRRSSIEKRLRRSSIGIDDRLEEIAVNFFRANANIICSHSEKWTPVLSHLRKYKIPESITKKLEVILSKEKEKKIEAAIRNIERARDVFERAMHLEKEAKEKHERARIVLEQAELEASIKKIYEEEEVRRKKQKLDDAIAAAKVSVPLPASRSHLEKLLDHSREEGSDLTITCLKGKKLFTHTLFFREIPYFNCSAKTSKKEHTEVSLESYDKKIIELFIDYVCGNIDQHKIAQNDLVELYQLAKKLKYDPLMNYTCAQIGKLDTKTFPPEHFKKFPLAQVKGSNLERTFIDRFRPKMNWSTLSADNIHYLLSHYGDFWSPYSALQTLLQWAAKHSKPHTWLIDKHQELIKLIRFESMALHEKEAAESLGFNVQLPKKEKLEVDSLSIWETPSGKEIIWRIPTETRNGFIAKYLENKVHSPSFNIGPLTLHLEAWSSQTRQKGVIRCEIVLDSQTPESKVKTLSWLLPDGSEQTIAISRLKKTTHFIHRSSNYGHLYLNGGINITAQFTCATE